MSWITAHKTECRAAELVLLLVAIMGPWAFDLINVPSEYPCSAPNIRLEGDYCGMPVPMLWILSSIAAGLIGTVGGLVAGTAAIADLRWVLLVLLLVLPFFSTLLLVLRGERRRWQVFDVAAWGLAVGVALLLGKSGYPKLFWVLWGVWLYVGLAASALVLEVLTLRRQKVQV
jgi:hypothetical protein